MFRGHPYPSTLEENSKVADVTGNMVRRKDGKDGVKRECNIEVSMYFLD